MPKEVDIQPVVDLIVNALQLGNKVIVFGVGGNAATAIHFSAELAGKFETFETPLACIDLCSNPSIITAITNDFGWDVVFSRQIEAIGKPNDVVLAFSISTKAQYLYKALVQAKSKGCETALICGKYSFGLAPRLIDVRLELDSTDTPWVQEQQLHLVHEICREVKRQFP
jgi:D-sedoheptulose 7-phosphate isomerase